MFDPDDDDDLARISAALPKQVIRTMRDPYRKRPRPGAVPTPYLLDIELGQARQEATPYISVEALGKTRFCEFSTARRFESVEEARAYALEHGITDHDLD